LISRDEVYSGTMECSTSRYALMLLCREAERMPARRSNSFWMRDLSQFCTTRKATADNTTPQQSNNTRG
jgi:hypothetical protein